MVLVSAEEGIQLAAAFVEVAVAVYAHAEGTLAASTGAFAPVCTLVAVEGVVGVDDADCSNAAADQVAAHDAMRPASRGRREGCRLMDWKRMHNRSVLEILE